MTKEIEQMNIEQELFPEIKKSYVVNQSPVLINMRQNLDVMERRIVYTLIALVQPEDKEFKSYVMKAKDLADLIGIHGGSVYKRLEAAVNSLMSKQLVFESDNGKTEERIQWVARSKYERGKGLIHIRLSNDLKDFLLNLASYTKYRLMYVLPLKSEYSWRMYELLKDEAFKTKEPKIYSKTGKEYTRYRVMRVSEIRSLLNLKDDEFTLMKVFRKSVIEVAKQELEEKTDIKFEYDVYQKVGRSIDSFIFFIESNNAKNIDVDEEKNDLRTLLYQLVKFNIRREKAIKILEKYSSEYVAVTLQYVYTLKETPSNTAGYIISALEKNYAKYTGEQFVQVANVDNSFRNIYLTNLDERLKVQTSKDVEQLINTFEDYQKRHYLNDQDAKDLFYKVLNDISKERKENNLPPLLKKDLPRENKELQLIYTLWLVEDI